MPAVPAPDRAPSARQSELLERAYAYTLEHGIADLSLRPLAAAIGSSPRVLLFLFGSKEGVIRALLARARADELALVRQARRGGAGHADGSGDEPDDNSDDDLATVVTAIWEWLVSPEHRPLLTLWLEAYSRSLSDPDGPWAGFARGTVEDWLALLGESRHGAADSGAGSGADSGTSAECTLALTVLLGALLDLLATGDIARTTAAVRLLYRTRESRRRTIHPNGPIKSHN